MKIGDKIYRYYESLPVNIQELHQNDFGVIIDIKTRIEEHPHNGDEMEINTYIIKTDDGFTSSVLSGAIITVHDLFNILCKRRYELINMEKILLEHIAEDYEYVCEYCGLSLGKKKDFKDLDICPRCNEILRVAMQI